MADIINFGGNKTVEPVDPTTIPITQYDYEITYTGEDAPATERVQGFLTVMGDYYFIGRGTPGKIDWVWSSPQCNVFKIVGVPIA